MKQNKSEKKKAVPDQTAGVVIKTNTKNSFFIQLNSAEAFVNEIAEVDIQKSDNSPDSGAER